MVVFNFIGLFYEITHFIVDMKDEHKNIYVLDCGKDRYLLTT